MSLQIPTGSLGPRQLAAVHYHQARGLMRMAACAVNYTVLTRYTPTAFDAAAFEAQFDEALDRWARAQASAIGWASR
jgi:hypothetical protein